MFVQTRMVPEREGRIYVEDVASAIDEHTRVVTISHVRIRFWLPERCSSTRRNLPRTRYLVRCGCHSESRGD